MKTTVSVLLVSLLALSFQPVTARAQVQPSNKAATDYACQWVTELQAGDVVEFNGAVESHQSYDVVNTGGGKYVTFFVGERQSGKTPRAFLNWLVEHVTFVRESLLSLGLKRYTIVATSDFEIAIQAWESEEKMQAAFQTPAGQAVVADAGLFMNGVYFGTLGGFLEQFGCE